MAATRRRLRAAILLAAAAPLLAGAPGAAAQGTTAEGARSGPPHEWVFGSWTGGVFPAGEVDPSACFGSPIVIFTRDLVMRAAVLDVAYHQRTIETAATSSEGLEFRFLPAASLARAMGGRLPPDIGFGCPGGPDVLRVQRRGPDEIVFPDCAEFLSPLKRCAPR